MNIRDLEQEIRNFVAVGGLRAWSLKIRCDIAGIGFRCHLSAVVPDRKSGRQRTIEMYEVSTLEEIRLARYGPREFVRHLIHKFVAHEVDESLAFRRWPALRAVWTEETQPIPMTVEPLAGLDRPFDPHTGENR